MKSCVEVVSYRLKEGVSEEMFMEAVDLLAELLSGESALKKREVFREEDSGTWVEVAEWTSREAAKQCEARVMADPRMSEAMALIDESTLRMLFVAQVR
ncbi:hypothetical protein [Paenibacillus sp. PL2-23]|uniref:hypothetical protein n=1 Tax=Paenibacillus sp. PL2-23 TaxID=2100729 RepID=UPI0030FC2725